jgi:hypothetical protein
MAERCLLSMRDISMPPPNKIDEEIASAINTALFHLQAPAQLRMMNTRMNVRSSITDITHQNVTEEIALQ